MAWNIGGRPRLGLESKMDFGKYEGRKVDDLLDEDPRYLEWCLDSVTGFAERLADGLEDSIRDAAADADGSRGDWADFEDAH